MPRKGFIPQRKVLPDPVYNSSTITRLINNIMLDGKRGIAQQILYDAFEKIEAQTGQKAMDVFQQAVEKITPQLEVRARRVGGANYQVPCEVKPNRKMTLCLRWLTQYARLRKEKTMEDRLAAEIIDASKGLGNAVKKREDTQRMAESNKAFAHYSW